MSGRSLWACINSEGSCSKLSRVHLLIPTRDLAVSESLSVACREVIAGFCAKNLSDLLRRCTRVDNRWSTERMLTHSKDPVMHIDNSRTIEKLGARPGNLYPDPSEVFDTY